MNKEQEKNLRRLLLRNEPALHPRIPQDVDRLLQLHSPRHSSLNKRKETIAWLNDLISTTFGKQFSVRNVSLSQYALDFEYAPLELAIVDGARKDGLPPGTEDEYRMGPYDPMNLIKLLQEHGLTGSLIDGDAFNLRVPVETTPTIEEMEPPLEYPPWSEPKFFHVPYIQYPAVLRAEGTKNLLPFHLSPPMPTLEPLNKLLNAYFCKDMFKKLVTFVYLWIRTIGLEQLSPTCVALMVIVFLQDKKGVPVLQQPENQSLEELQKEDRGVWVVADFPPRFPLKSFYVETGFFNQNFASHVLDKQIKSYIHGFLEFWSTHHPKSKVIASEQAFSVRTGKFTARPSAAIKEPSALHLIQESFAKIQCGANAWSPLDPPVTWRHQPIVIEDPFIPSFNHARTLSPHASRFLHNAAAVSRRTLHHGHSIHNILGHALSHHKRQYSTSTLSQQIRDSYIALTPPYQVFDRRKLTISRIEKVIRKEFGGQFHVLNFGSTRYGVSVANSDLDLVVMDPQYPVGLAPHVKLSKLSPIYSVRNVGQALASYRFTNVYIIPTASVPIVRCRDPTTGIDCDININDRLGLINTLLMESYTRIAPNIRPMCVAIKRWAKYCNLNDSAGIFGPRTFSSYTLVLMVIGYLQMKGILPNLQAGFDPLPSNPRRGIFYKRLKRKTILCDTRFREVDRNVSPVDFELGEELLGWFNFWGNEFDYVNQLMSISQGGLLERTLGDQVSMIKRLKKKAKKEAKGKEKAEAGISDDHEPGMDQEVESVELDAEESEDDAVAAWHEQEEELEEDEVSESLPADLTQIQGDGSVAEVSETVVSARPKSSIPWKGEFVIVDPFMQGKNLTSQFNLPRLKQFQSECRSAVELIKSGGTLEDLIPSDQAQAESDDDDNTKRSKKKKKKSRLGIAIKPHGTPKDIGKIEPQPKAKKQNKKQNDKGKKSSHPPLPSSPPSENPPRPQEPSTLAGPSTALQN